MTFHTVDSHCHIDLAQFDEDRDAVLERAASAGVSSMLVVGEYGEEGGEVERALGVASAAGLPASAGLHPHQASLRSPAIEDTTRGLARDGRIVAVGEIGLDYYYDHSPRPDQEQAFRDQIRLARDVGLPIIVHTRDADDDCAQILEEENAAEVGGVIHCFTGGAELARRALALGFYVSFSGIVTFPRAEGIQAVARAVPEDRILVETDAPFLAPPPHRGKRNEPAFVVEVARFVAGLRGCSPEHLGGVAAGNFARLFRV